MNLRKLCTAVLSAAGALLLASTSFASPTAPQILAVGSSGIFTSMGIAAVNGDPQTGATTICGSNFWTTKTASGIAYATDARNGSIPTEGGNLWVAWDADPPNVVCAYLSVDSVVGQRLFLGQAVSGNAELTVTAAAKTTAGANAVSFVKDTATSGLPASVWNVLTDNGNMDQHFNMALTDIRPEDGQYAYSRAACNRAGIYDASCFGYGPPGGIGTAILSSYSSTSAQVVAYAISGTDPITGITIPAFQTIPIGADPVLVFYNTSDTSSGGLGTLLPTNITDTTAGMIWSGQFGLVAQLVGAAGSTKTLTVAQREPVSGTYNTFEFQMVHDRDNYGGAWTQEFGFGPTPNCNATFVLGSPQYTPPPDASDLGCANPMDVAGAQGNTYGGRRTRAIGTGEMVSAVNSSNNPNSIGYAFWGLGTFGGKTNTKYMTVNGAEPLFASYSTNNGAPPSCTGYFNTTPAFSCTGAFSPVTNVTFTNLTNGGYRVWSTIRAVIYSSYTPPATGPSVQTLILAAQDQAHVNIPDFVPSVYCTSGSGGSCTGGTTTGMPVFRSHYPISNVNPNNGVISPSSEAGGDMAGRAFYNVQEQDFYALTGNYLYTFIE